MLKISQEYALKIAKILIDLGGATPRILLPHNDFLPYLTEESRFGHEYRFMGHLGSGGKFCTSWNKWQVTCYQEDETPPRMKLIEQINKELSHLYHECKILP